MVRPQRHQGVLPAMRIPMLADTSSAAPFESTASPTGDAGAERPTQSRCAIREPGTAACPRSDRAPQAASLACSRPSPETYNIKELTTIHPLPSHTDPPSIDKQQ